MNTPNPTENPPTSPEPNMTELDLAYMSIDTLKAQVTRLEEELRIERAKTPKRIPLEEKTFRDTWSDDARDDDSVRRGIGGGPGY